VIEVAGLGFRVARLLKAGGSRGEVGGPAVVVVRLAAEAKRRGSAAGRVGLDPRWGGGRWRGQQEGRRRGSGNRRPRQCRPRTAHSGGFLLGFASQSHVRLGTAPGARGRQEIGLGAERSRV
jgi:hypothetical protein